MRMTETMELLASSGPLELAVPDCTPGIGDVILSSGSANLIKGVRIEPFAIWPDDRGYFLEIARLGLGMVQQYDLSSTQVSAALSYPGTVKAFHFHLHQTDCWVPGQGLFQFVLVDFRLDSPTFGKKNTMYVGSLRPWRVLIPPGIGHGYKVVGREAAMLVYLTNRFYDPKDEGRVAYNHPRIRYDWDLQHK
jgi:dTDP-4-dehydrorhamnose 3,5-epimerase